MNQNIAQSHSATDHLSQQEVSPFETHCINLLFKQDHLLESIAAQEPIAGRIGSLEVCFQILAELLEFAEVALPGEQAEEVVECIRRIYDRTKELKQAMTGSSWGGVQRLWGGNAPEPQELQELHRQLGVDLGALCGEVIEGAANSFSSTAQSRRFRELTELLGAELERQW